MPSIERRHPAPKDSQFVLRELLLVVTVLATILAVLRLLHLFAVVIAFLVAIGLTATLTWRSNATGLTSRSRWILDTVWGIFMPLLCLGYDHGVFANYGFLVAPPSSDYPHDYNVLAYAVFLTQMSALFLWLVGGRHLKLLAGGFAGFLVIGAIAALVIAILLLPLSLIGILFLGIGLLGLTPLFTALSFYRRSREAFDIARHNHDFSALCCYVSFGATIAIAIPIIILCSISSSGNFNFRFPFYRYIWGDFFMNVLCSHS